MRNAARILALLMPVALMTSPVYAKKEKGPRVAPEVFMAAPPVATGSIKRFLVNPHGEVDGLLLADGTLAKFPPHMGRELIAVVKTNDTVSVRGYREPGGTVKTYIVTNEASKQQVIERPPIPGFGKMPKHLRFASLGRLKAAGRVERAMYGKKGEIKGVLLEDGTVVRFPKHAAYQFPHLLQQGQSIAAEGLGTENQYGRGLEATAIGASPDALQPIYGR